MKFSIITITLNSAKTLEETLESVRGQSFKDFEHIFVDGNSTDNTLTLLETYKQQTGDRVKVFQSKPKGISAAMNEGIRHASGDYIMHLHADDTLCDADVLSDVVEFLEQKKIDWLYGKIMVQDERGKNMGTFPDKKIFQASYRDRFKSWLLQLFNYIPHQAVFIRRDCFEKFGLFDESLTSAMDPDLWLRIRTKTNWTFMNRCISTFRLRSDSQTGSKEKQKENRENVRQVHGRHLTGLTYVLARMISKMVRIKQYFN